MSIGCITVNSLSEFSIIGGTACELIFTATYEDGEPVDLSSSTTKWTLSYMGDPDNAIATVNGEVYDVNKFIIKMSSDITKELSGKVVHQPILVDYDGNEYRLAQGLITIISRIQNT